MAPHSSLRLFVALLCVSVGGGCFSSSHRPRNDGRVTTVWDGPVRTYHRDGRVYRQGFFLGGLGEAVQGVPEAEAAARTYRRRSNYGGALFGVGFACSLLAIPIAIKTRDDREVNHSATLLTSAACLVAAIAGVTVALSGQPYHEDAINIFNDSLQPDEPILLPGQRPRHR